MTSQNPKDRIHVWIRTPARKRIRRRTLIILLMRGRDDLFPLAYLKWSASRRTLTFPHGETANSSGSVTQGGIEVNSAAPRCPASVPVGSHHAGAAIRRSRLFSVLSIDAGPTSPPGPSALSPVFLPVTLSAAGHNHPRPASAKNAIRAIGEESPLY